MAGGGPTEDRGSSVGSLSEFRDDVERAAGMIDQEVHGDGRRGEDRHGRGHRHRCGTCQEQDTRISLRLGGCLGVDAARCEQSHIRGGLVESLNEGFPSVGFWRKWAAPMNGYWTHTRKESRLVQCWCSDLINISLVVYI